VAVVAAYSNQMEPPMKKILIATAMTLMCSAAMAQNGTGPASQSDNMNKPGMNNGMDNTGMKSGTTGMSQDGMSKKGMKKGSMSNDSMKHDSMSKDMKK
jgi:pentapeptide MXKDX repeat protein